jgi:glycosyltransferase involved in cell wall biosynthesis
MDKSGKKMPKVSVVTIVRNNREFIAEAIESVLSQSYPDIEYIVKDGDSTDGTMDVLRRYNGRIKLMTGKDRGLYDALNKGLQAATGDILMHLNADDFYSNKNSVAHMVRAMEETGADIGWGDMIYVDRGDRTKVTRRWHSTPYSPGRFQRGWHPPHAGFSVRRSVYEKYGWFDANLRISGDYELMLRFLEKHKVKSCYVPETIVTMRAGGVSGTTWNRLTRVRKEDLTAWRMNGLKGGLVATILKPLSKLAQL